MPEAAPMNIVSAKPAQPQLETCLNLLRHLNPSKTEINLKLLGEALPELKDSLMEVVDVPSKVIIASEANNREFLEFKLNKSSPECYRCPWDSKMYKVDGTICICEPKYKNVTEELNQLESALNKAISTYASLYYGTDSITSVYVETKSSEFDGNFTVAVLIKKGAEHEDDENGSSSKATWDSVHLFEIAHAESEWIYNHTATVMLSFDNSVENLKKIVLAGKLIRQNESKYPKTSEFSTHLVNIGSSIEEVESRLRNDLQSVYFGRTHDIVNELRSAMPEGFLRNQNDFREEMMARLNK